jgi:hypothetical protein
LSGLKGEKSDAIAELAAKLKPEAAEKFKDLGLDINGKIGGAIDKAVDAASDATSALKSSSLPDEDTIKKALSAGGEKLAKAGKNAKQMTEVLKDFAPKNEEDAMRLAAALAKSGGNELTVEDTVERLCQGQKWFEDLDSDAANELRDKINMSAFHPDDINEFLGGASDAADTATDAASTATDAAASTAADATDAAADAADTADAASTAVDSMP